MHLARRKSGGGGPLKGKPYGVKTTTTTTLTDTTTTEKLAKNDDISKKDNTPSGPGAGAEVELGSVGGLDKLSKLIDGF